MESFPPSIVKTILTIKKSNCNDGFDDNQTPNNIQDIQNPANLSNDIEYTGCF